MGNNDTSDKDIDDTKKKKFKLNNLQKRVLSTFALMVVIFAGYYSFSYASSPEHMRRPAFDHYHFRTQLIVDGEAVDFSQNKFQEEINTTSCSIELSGTPIDFHDNVDQMTHIHWNGVKGGELLKYYGWNFTGGNDNTLGTRYDQGMMNPHSVQIKGNLLPDVPDNANFYIYTGDESNYKKRDWQQFIDSDLEEFFGKKSLIGASNPDSNWLTSLFFAKAYAHGGIDDGHEDEDSSTTDKTDAELEKINNLIGNVVIFAQESEPTEDEIRERFNNLVPLTESTCGG